LRALVAAGEPIAFAVKSKSSEMPPTARRFSRRPASVTRTPAPASMAPIFVSGTPSSRASAEIACSASAGTVNTSAQELPRNASSPAIKARAAGNIGGRRRLPDKIA
jgi:hypothetical protein